MDSREEFTKDVADNGSEMSSLEWVELQAKIDELQGNQETFWQKAGRRTLENPIAPIGLIAACGFLGFGLKALNRGDSRKQQLMMRGRVISQAIGIGSIMLGLMMATKN
ncbi:HIG1 domain member 2A [Tyrophagus putrescentiae]|nr:HIG1 domain member 2A [Tyrophagus putrescentiae]